MHYNGGEPPRHVVLTESYTWRRSPCNAGSPCPTRLRYHPAVLWLERALVAVWRPTVYSCRRWGLDVLAVALAASAVRVARMKGRGAVTTVARAKHDRCDGDAEEEVPLTLAMAPEERRRGDGERWRCQRLWCGWRCRPWVVAAALAVASTTVAMVHHQESLTLPWNRACAWDGEGHWSIGYTMLRIGQPGEPAAQPRDRSGGSPDLVTALVDTRTRFEVEVATETECRRRAGVRGSTSLCDGSAPVFARVLSCADVAPVNAAPQPLPTAATFVADPFLLPANPSAPPPWAPTPAQHPAPTRPLQGESPVVTWYLFFELKDAASRTLARNGHGVIGFATSTDESARSFTFGGVALREPWHLSYPYVFWFQRRPYMVVETSKKPPAGGVYLYSTTPDAFPGGWEPVRELVVGRFADASLFQHTDGRWYLFTSSHDRQVCASAARGQCSPLTWVGNSPQLALLHVL